MNSVIRKLREEIDFKQNEFLKDQEFITEDERDYFKEGIHQVKLVLDRYLPIDRSINSYSRYHRNWCFEMLNDYDNDIDKLLKDLEDLQKIQKRLGKQRYYRNEIDEDVLDLLCGLEEDEIQMLSEDYTTNEYGELISRLKYMV